MNDEMEEYGSEMDSIEFLEIAAEGAERLLAVKGFASARPKRFLSLSNSASTKKTRSPRSCCGGPRFAKVVFHTPDKITAEWARNRIEELRARAAEMKIAAPERKSEGDC